jgi:hypothetical protein
MLEAAEFKKPNVPNVWNQWNDWNVWNNSVA